MSKTTAKRKHVRAIRRSTESHWVGDGFPVQTIFSYDQLGAQLSPFLLLDYAGPAEFPPTDRRLGVGEHPHRGFETVTICYQGQVEHRDSSGGGGIVGPGDVQWMTAASGVVHDEFHGPDFARTGGTFEMLQLWVNLPAKDKMSAPRYQGIQAADIPSVGLRGANGESVDGEVQVIAGTYAGVTGPAKTCTPMDVWNLHIKTDKDVVLELPEGHTAAIVVRRGSMIVNGSESIDRTELAMLDREGTHVCIERSNGAQALLLSGAPIDEPIVGQGPFVMNTSEEIRQATLDFVQGKMGRL